VLPVLGDRRIDAITAADVAELVAKLAGEGKARETIRKSVRAPAMVLDHIEITPNPARNRVQVRLPLEERRRWSRRSPTHVEAVAHLLTIPYTVALLVLDATGARVGELEATTLGDLDEKRKAWLVRKEISKTRQARWVALPDDVCDVLVDRLPAGSRPVPPF
jgi:integrase